jgi:hypothetical protein
VISMAQRVQALGPALAGGWDGHDVVLTLPAGAGPAASPAPLIDARSPTCDALAAFRQCRWSLDYLRPDTART